MSTSEKMLKLNPFIPVFIHQGPKHTLPGSMQVHASSNRPSVHSDALLFCIPELAPDHLQPLLATQCAFCSHHTRGSRLPVFSLCPCLGPAFSPSGAAYSLSPIRARWVSFLVLIVVLRPLLFYPPVKPLLLLVVLHPLVLTIFKVLIIPSFRHICDTWLLASSATQGLPPPQETLASKGMGHPTPWASIP